MKYVVAALALTFSLTAVATDERDSADGSSRPDDVDAREIPASGEQRQLLEEIERRRDQGMGSPALEGTQDGADYNDAHQSDILRGPNASETGGFEQRESEQR